MDGEFTVKRIKKEKDKLYLMAENKKYKLIGLPFFNNQNKNTFLKKFNKEVLEV